MHAVAAVMTQLNNPINPHLPRMLVDFTRIGLGPYIWPNIIVCQRTESLVFAFMTEWIKERLFCKGYSGNNANTLCHYRFIIKSLFKSKLLMKNEFYRDSYDYKLNS